MYTRRNLRRSSATQFVDETTGLIPANDSIFTLHIKLRLFEQSFIYMIRSQELIRSLSDLTLSTIYIVFHISITVTSYETEKKLVVESRTLRIARNLSKTQNNSLSQYD